MTQKMIIKHLYLMCCFAYLVTGCNLTSSNHEPDNIFGYWKLDRIVYESGEVLRPGDGDSSPANPEDEVHLLGFLDIEASAEEEYNKKLTGVSYCNLLSGSFNEKPGRELDMNLVSTRAGCGISPEFIFAVGSSHSYYFKSGNLHLLFKNHIEELEKTISGQVFLVPF